MAAYPRAIALTLLVICCLAAILEASPATYRDSRRGVAPRRFSRRRPTGLFAARTNEAPVFAAPEDAPEDEPAPFVEPLQDFEEEAQRPGARSSNSGEDFGAPPQYKHRGGDGATAVATSYSRGAGAQSNSHAVAYRGNFSGGQFKHRYGSNGKSKPAQ